MESMVPALRSSAVGGGTHAPNFLSSGRFGRTKNEGQSTNGGGNMSGVCSLIAINDFPALCVSCAFGRRGLAFLDDSDGASILARGSYGRGILQHMPSSNPPRTYLGSASPLGNNALPFASPRRRVSGKVLPVSIDWCIPRGNNVSVCSMRVSYNEPLPSRQCPSLSTFMVRASPARGGWVRNQRRMHRSGHKTRGFSRGIVPRTSPSSSRRQRSGHRCHDSRHHDRRFFYPSSVRTSSLQDFVRGRAHVIHFRLGVDIRVRYF